MRMLVIALAIVAALPLHANEEIPPLRPMLAGIYAVDYERTLAWYRDNLGFSVNREVVNEDGNIRLGFLDNGAFELEIYADIVRDPASGRATRDRFGMPGEGFVKLTFETDDLAAMAALFQANEVEVVRDINESDRKPGQSWIMVADPDGNFVQVFGPTPGPG